MPFHFQNDAAEYREPQPAEVPNLVSANLFALYRGARTGGDFYDFLSAGGRVLMILCDISGKRKEAQHVAAAVQECFRQRGTELFDAADLNEAERLSDLALSINREIIRAAGGPRHCPAFLGCFTPVLGTLVYINAGHPPALVRDQDGIFALEASGLPLGLFSHTVHDAQMFVLRPGASLLLVSRGVIEVRGAREEYGIARVKESLYRASFDDAQELCAAVQAAAQRFVEDKPLENDLTTVALVRPSAMARGFSA